MDQTQDIMRNFFLDEVSSNFNVLCLVLLDFTNTLDYSSIFCLERKLDLFDKNETLVCEADNSPQKGSNGSDTMKISRRRKSFFMFLEEYTTHENGYLYNEF
uniref:Uncharacterized protein n=1 Tax=Solanum tuberosum TaxID=4113 RepID=M1BP70_SOLTU